MAYEPTIWKDGDLVTSAKLNKLEQGIANGGGMLIVNVSISGSSDMICDKTAGEIYEAFKNGNVRFILNPGDTYEAIMNLTICERNLTSYHFTIESGFTMHAATADDYPTNGESESDDDDDNSGVR